MTENRPTETRGGQKEQGTASLKKGVIKEEKGFLIQECFGLPVGMKRGQPAFRLPP